MFTTPNVSCVMCHVARVTCHMSHVTCHMSHVTCHLSPVTCHVSLFFFFFLFRQSGEAYPWRVCYQRGLPRLVFLLCDPCLGDSMSKVREKRSTSKSGFFLMKYEKEQGKLMILTVLLTTLVIWGSFLAKIKNTQKLLFGKSKNFRKKCFFFKIEQLFFKYHIYHSYSMNFMILLICFVICNIFGHFLPF